MCLARQGQRQLHYFADASAIAYGGVTYLHAQDSQGL